MGFDNFFGEGKNVDTNREAVRIRFDDWDPHCRNDGHLRSSSSGLSDGIENYVNLDRE